MENKEKQRYLPMRDANDPHKVTLIPVTEDVYAEVSRETNRIRSRRQYHGQCCCPKQYIWKCDADCVGQKIVDEDLSERKVLEQLDLKRSTYRSQLEKARKQLESEFGKIF